MRRPYSLSFRFLNLLFLVYAIIAFIFSLYDYYQPNGVHTFLIEKQFELFDEFYLSSTRIATLLLFWIPLIPMYIYLNRRDEWNPLAAIFSERFVELSIGVRTALAFLIPMLIAASLYFLGWSQAKHDAARPVYQMNLKDEVKVPEDAKFVEIYGMYRGDLSYLIDKKSNSGGNAHFDQAYGPLTDPHWSEHEKVEFFVESNTPLFGDFQFGKKNSFDAKHSFEGNFQGIIRKNALPGFIERFFERSGIQVTEPYFVLSYDPKKNQDPMWFFMNRMRWFILAAGLGVGLGLASRTFSKKD